MSFAAGISRESSVLVVHDVVNSFLDPAAKSYDLQIPLVMKNIAALLAAARRARLPVLFAAPGPGDNGIGPRRSAVEAGTLAWGTPACDVPSMLGPLPGETIVRKPRYGAFFGTALTERLRDMGRDTMIICGLSLAGGVETSVRDAHNHDLNSILVADSCLCRPIPDQGFGPVSRQEVEKVTLSLLAQRFARIASTAEICRELQDV
jgi:ureidoacrylate peracid hydrolase